MNAKQFISVQLCIRSCDDFLVSMQNHTLMNKEYSNGEITVVWQPNKCQHAGICVKTLPQVYNPKAKPWIKVEHATTQELKNQINNCPSGALSYYTND